MTYTSLLGPKDPDKGNDKGGRGTAGPAGDKGFNPERPRSGHGGLWAAVALLAISLSGAAVWAYHEIESDRERFGGFDQSDAVASLQSGIESIDDRISTMANRVATSEVVQGLRARMDDLEQTMTRGLEATRNDIAEVRSEYADLDFRIQSTVESRTSPIRERLSELEAAELDRAAEIDRLRSELVELRHATAGEFAEVLQNDAAAHAGLENRVAGAERRLDIVAYAVDRDRVDFEMYRDLDEEIAPGIVLHLNDVDRRYQRVNGWIRLVPEGRLLWISDHPIQQSLVFYTHQDERAHELVFTRVTETAAAGYLRVPSESAVQTAGQDWTTPSVAVAVID
jgi:hypothetical protein